MSSTCSATTLQRCGQLPSPSRSIARRSACVWPTQSPSQRRLQRRPQSCSQRLPARCQAAGGFSQPTGGDQAAALPNTREDCISQAAASIASQLTAGFGTGKGFADGGGRKLTVDVPVLDSGAAALVQLAQDIVAALPRQLAKKFTVVSCADGPVPSSSGGGARVVSLQQCVARGDDLDGCLIIAGPSSAQLDATMRLLAYWRGPAAVVLNAEWSPDSVPVEQMAFIKSFEAVYCFQPLMVKVLFIGQEGAVFKNVVSGNPASTPWRVFGREGGSKMVPIGRMQQRPTNDDLEAIFYNQAASNTPINKGIKFLRGLGGDKK